MSMGDIMKTYCHIPFVFHIIEVIGKFPPVYC